MIDPRDASGGGEDPNEVSPAAICVQVEGILRYVNPAALRLFGEARAQDMLGRPLLDYIHPAERGEVTERMRRIREDGVAFAPTPRRFVRRDGTQFTAEVTAAPHTFQGRRGGMAVVRDMTGRRRAEERILALNAELESFSYSVSHDLRAPLRAIHGFADLLAQQAGGALDERARHYLGRVQEAAARMGRLIDDLLHLSHVTRAPVRPEDLDLSRLAGQVIDELRAGDPGRQVEAAIAPGLAARGDPALVRVALQNLLENAWKFTRGAAAPRIEVGREGEAFFVRDNGAGFDMRYAEKLFGAFQRLHADGQFAGSGIGLATVRRIVARHGGRVWGEGAPGQGATFRFTLPDPSAGG